MTDKQKVEALQDLCNKVISSLELTVYDIDDPYERSKVNKLADGYFQQMLNIIHSND
jgi:hypothetical protein